MSLWTQVFTWRFPGCETAEDAKGRRGLLAGEGNDSVIPAKAGIQFLLETTEVTEATESERILLKKAIVVGSRPA